MNSKTSLFFNFLTVVLWPVAAAYLSLRFAWGLTMQHIGIFLLIHFIWMLMWFRSSKYDKHLRDEIAIAAMQGELGSQDEFSGYATKPEHYRELAIKSYEIADALLEEKHNGVARKEREKRTTKTTTGN